MKRLFKYDVAISVAEEEKEVAKLIAAELKKRGICYYYYDEAAAAVWGEYIINLTADAYGRRSRYVLMITSEIFVKKYWANIERQIALANTMQGKPHILQLRLDNTLVSGISEHVVYRDWQDNAEEIAITLKEKIGLQRRAEFVRAVGSYSVIMAIIAAIFLTYYISKPKVRATAKNLDKPIIERLPVISNIDTFYVSNAEVTVGEYRKFCENQHWDFPPQPLSSGEYIPVSNVTWYEAVEYCKSVGGRLPTEAEWEFAAGAGISVIYSGSNNASKVGIYNRQRPHRVATKEPNAFMLYDMTGNVAEWCSDWSDTSATWKSVRGGAYNSRIRPVNELAVYYRSKELPNNRQPYIGFRVVWENIK